MAYASKGCCPLIDKVAHTLRYPDSPADGFSWKGRIGTLYTANKERSKQVESQQSTLVGKLLHSAESIAPHNNAMTANHPLVSHLLKKDKS